MRIKLMLLLLSLIVSCKNKTEVKLENVSENRLVKHVDEKMPDLEIYDFNGLEKFLNNTDNKVYVVNFWATWCAPCVKELPYFEKLREEYSKDELEVLLVSLDFPHLYDTKLKPFIREHQLKSKVVALDDVDMNTWIPKVDTTWSGSIPATIIYKKGNRKFYEQSFDFDTLKGEVEQFLN
ncbi:TlpA family protein disulfide reductase [Gaetbulibacter saemankumensis]|uniref:TlpA family protein disulfide reductase n=1 Tax=Gaetbulibacter saemankumensis TaxID=311208 RepID=UPI00048027CD|nr:TlpA disulfide reductase family protein [Gaetbulibacter saemankumensis]